MNAVTGLLAVALAATPAVAQMRPIATYTQGEVQFTQAGKTAKWTLYRGDAQELPGPREMKTASLMYTPDGMYPTSTAPSFKLTVGSFAGTTTIAVLAVEGGPAGNSVYRSRLAQCTVKIVKLDASGVEGSGTCTGSFEGGPAVTQFRFTAMVGSSRPPGPTGRTSLTSLPSLLVDARWTYDVQLPQVGWVRMQVHALYRTEAVRHPRHGWTGARTCVGVVDIPVRWDSVAVAAPFCLKLNYVDGAVIYATGETTAGKTKFEARPLKERSAFPDGRVWGPVDGAARIELDRVPSVEAVENDEAMGCVQNPTATLSYADVHNLATLTRTWNKPSWDDWANTCAGTVLLEIRVRPTDQS